MGIKNIKNPEVFRKKPFEEFRKGDIVKIKSKNRKLYKIIGTNPDDSMAILEGKKDPVDFSQLEFVSDELGDKLFKGAMDAASRASKVVKKDKERLKKEELIAA